MYGIPTLLSQTCNDMEVHGKVFRSYVEHWIGEKSLMSEFDL